MALWNPYLYCGAPYFAGFQSALLYPPNWLFIVLPLVFALNFSITLHVFLAGFFTYLWLCSNRVGFLSALFGAFVFMFGGAYFLHVYPGHLPNLCTMAWIPLALLSVEGLLKKPGLKGVLLGAGILSLQLLSGHAQYFVYTLLMAGLYAALLIFRDPSLGPKKIYSGLAMFLMALLVTAVQWLPSLESIGEFGREPSGSPADAAFFSLHPLALVSLLAPEVFNGPSPHSCWTDSRIWWESVLYIGPAAFLFVLNAVRKSGNDHNWIPLGLALLSLLLALGPLTPLYPLLERLPLFHSFRGSFKFCIFFQAFAALLSARGLQAWLQEEKSAKTLSLWALGLAFLSLLAVAGTWMTGGMERPLSLAGAFLGFLLLGLLGRTGKPQWKVALALLGMGSLLAFAGANLPVFGAQELKSGESRVQDTLASVLGEGRIFWTAHDDRALSVELPDIWGDDPLIPKRYDYFMGYGGGPAQGEASTADAKKIYLTSPKIRLTRLSYILENRNGETGLTRISAQSLPRFFLVGRWKGVATAKEAMDYMSQKGFDPGAEVVLEQAPAISPEENTQPGRISSRDWTTDNLELRVQTQKPQILVMTDNYSRGWRARACADSVQQNYEVTPGDAFARAIPLAAGLHHFNLIYDPPGFALGRGITLTALPFYALGWIGMAWHGRRRKADPGQRKETYES